MTTPKTRLFLDVDGVINAWYSKIVWPEDSIREGRVGPYKIVWSQEMVDHLFGPTLNLDIWWTTTWQDSANTSLSPLLFDEERSYEVVAPLSGEVTFPSIYWKFESVEAEVAANPGPFVWIDDELAPEHIEWAKSVGGLAIASDQNFGITPANINTIKVYLGGLNGA